VGVVSGEGRWPCLTSPSSTSRSISLDVGLKAGARSNGESAIDCLFCAPKGENSGYSQRRRAEIQVDFHPECPNNLWTSRTMLRAFSGVARPCTPHYQQLQTNMSFS